MFIHIFTKDSSDKAEDSFVPFFAKYFQVLLILASVEYSNFLRIVIDAEGFDRHENKRNVLVRSSTSSSGKVLFFDATS